MQTAALAAFLLGGAFAVYALIGYPLLLWRFETSFARCHQDGRIEASDRPFARL